MTSKQRTLILDQEHISRKLERMAYQIWEHNSDQSEVTLIGIADNGVTLARNLAERLSKISPLKIKIVTLGFNKINPLENLPAIDESLDGKSVILVDDVSNSGKVLLYALRPVLHYMPSKILLAVLVDRKHKAYPVTPDIVGYSLATTLQENILVTCDGDTITGAYLE